MGGRITRLAGSRLLVFNVCTSSIVYAAGDQIQQRFEGHRHRREADFRRSGRMTSVGAPIGALNHYWYMLLDRIIPGITSRAVVRKILADMIIFGPICLTAFFVGNHIKPITCIDPFFVGMGVLEGKNSKEIALDVKTLFPTAYLVCIKKNFLIFTDFAFYIHL